MLPGQVMNLLVCVYYIKIYLLDEQSYSPWAKSSDEDIEKQINAAKSDQNKETL